MHLVDVLQAIRNLDLKLQRRNANIVAYQNAIKDFLNKIQLCKRQCQAGNFSSFLHLKE
jgi:hypothetical protein